MKKILLIMLIIFSITGCTTENKKVEVKKNQGYPQTFIDTYKREVKIESEPKKVVSLAPNLTEIVYDLDLGNRLIGRTDFCDYPKEVEKVPVVGNLIEPNIEKIVELSPDIVLASDHFKKDSLKKLEENGIKVLILKENQTFNGTYKIIEDMGRAFNKEEKASKIVENMKTDIKKIESKENKGKKPTVYYVIGYGEAGDFTATGETFISDIIEKSGGTNIAKDGKGWKYSLEKLVEKDPDYIICSNKNNTKENLKKTNIYKDLTAIKKDRIIEIDENTIDRQGPRLVEGMRSISEGLKFK